jgi:iron(III) transport system substrate-binding protein
VGLTAFSRLRDKEKNPNLTFDVMYDLQPVMGVSTQVVVAIVNQAKHPNAAKLLIRWMMGDQEGDQGYEPYYVLGNFSVRTDVKPLEGIKNIGELNLWSANPDFVWENGQKIVEFWIANLM